MVRLAWIREELESAFYSPDDGDGPSFHLRATGAASLEEHLDEEKSEGR
jgi:hypothetical protein